MNSRQDSHAIKALTKRYGIETAVSIQQIPFFHITKEVEKEFTSSILLNDEGQRRQLPEYIVRADEQEEIEVLLPFKYFTLWIDDIGYFIINYNTKHETPIWEVSNVLDEHLAKMIDATTPDADMEGMLLTQDLFIKKRAASGETTGNITFGFHKTDDDNLNQRLSKILNGIHNETSIKKAQMKASLQTIEFMLSYFKWAEQQNKFLMQRQAPTTKHDAKAIKRKPWLRSDVSHYVYLNQLPTDHHKSSHQGGDGSSKRGHNRRAHWRHFTADRYKSAKGKRTRIKESWVGPTQTTYHGSTYTVLLQGDNT